MLFHHLLELLVSGWEITEPTDILKRPVDLIVPISYSILPNGLTLATKENLLMAARYRKYFPETPIALSNCAYTFPGAAEQEKRLRDEILRKWGIVTNVIWADDMNNSVQEARRIREAVERAGLKPRCVLIVTCRMHSRSAKYIWQKTFLEAEILCRTNSWFYEAEPAQPVKIQRSHWLWFLGNIARQALLVASYWRYGDFRLIENRHHRSNVETRG